MLKTTEPVIAIVVPCYNEESALKHTMPELLKILSNLAEKGDISEESYILCVDDGSRDATWRDICALASSYPAGFMVWLWLTTAATSMPCLPD